MFLKEIAKLLENRISPKIYSLDPEFYGFHYGDTGDNKIIKKVIVTSDLTIDLINFACKKKVNLIISLRALINKPINKFNKILMNKFFLLSRLSPTIFVLDCSFIAAEGGVLDTIIDILYLNLVRPFNIINLNGKKVPLGRICIPNIYPNQNKMLKLEDLIKRIKFNLNLKNVQFIGDLNKEINKIFLIGIETPNEEFVERAIKYKCDCFISGKINHNEAILARDLGLNLIELPKYEIENIALKNLCNHLSLEFPKDEFIFFNSVNPFNIY